jgi:phosphomannomutase
VQFANEQVNTTDGVKIDFTNGWVHLRKSNTEPIVRVYTEAPTEAEAQQLVSKVTDSLGVEC